MITLLIALNVQGEGNRDFVRHYETLPWPRLPNQGETIYLDTADLLMETDVPVGSVTFHPDSDDVVIELQGKEICPKDLEWLHQLLECGFTEAPDPFRGFGADPRTDTGDDHRCVYREALEEIDALDSASFQRGQEHLTPAFRTTNIADAFREVIRIVNGALHDKDEYGHPLT